MTKTVFYQGIGPELTRYDINVDGAALTKREAVRTPGGNIQYVWPHPSRTHLYVVSSDGGPGTNPGKTHIASAFRVDPATGALTPHGEPANLPSRPIHCCVNTSGRYLLTAYNFPSGITVHRLKADGSLGTAVAQPEALDTGIFAHQVLTTPGNRTAILVTRGNQPNGAKLEDPGALKVFSLADGVLRNVASIAPGGLGFGPRHLEFHPLKPWVFVSVERQSQLYVYRLNDDGTLQHNPLFVVNSLADRANAGPAQMAGAIHLHPNGRFVYQTNRNSSTEEVGGCKVFKGGENNVAVFAIDQATGAPKLIQNIEARTNHLRTFAIDPSGRLLIAASIQPIALRDGSMLPAALVLYRIGADGRLEFARKYDVDTNRFMQFWTGIVTLP
jgi:6-phosphogluconolactonase (cycloisomerase 2 family)